MRALVARIHVSAALQRCKDVDGRIKSGHDVGKVLGRRERNMLWLGAVISRRAAVERLRDGVGIAAGDPVE